MSVTDHTLLPLRSPFVSFIARVIMVNRRISDDLKMAALRLKARGRDSVTEILEIVRFSLSTFYRVQHRYHEVRTVAKAQAIGRGRFHKAA